jgi:Phage capsid family
MSNDDVDRDSEAEDRPYGARPYGARPYGARPYGARPYGARPYGARPYGARRADDASGHLDPDEWSRDIAEIFCGYSAVVRLGATIVATDNEVWVSAFDVAPDFRNPGSAPAAPGASALQSLRPRDYVLEAGLAVPHAVVRGIEADPDLAHMLKLDLARGLAVRADRAFLGDAAPTLPRGVRATAGQTAPDPDVLKLARTIVRDVRARAREFRCPGWVLSPGALEQLSRLQTADGLVQGAGRSLDTFPLLRLDGADGGTLLGYPFVTSLAEADEEADAGTLYFAADWQEACIGVDPSFVIVDEPAEPVAAGATVIRGSMSLDFLLRRPDGFAWS